MDQMMTKKHPIHSKWYTQRNSLVVVVEYKFPIVEASFMMMNQVDSRSFDDDKKLKRMISRLSQKVQDQD